VFVTGAGKKLKKVEKNLKKVKIFFGSLVFGGIFTLSLKTITTKTTNHENANFF